MSHRLQVFVLCIEHYLRAPLKTWAPVLLSTLALSLPTSIYLTANDLGFFSFIAQQSPELTVFLSKDIEPDTAQSVRQKISALSTVHATHLVSKHEALEDFKALTGLHAVANYLPDNPFVTTIIVQLAKEHVNPQAYDELSAMLYRIEYVDLVQFDRDWTTKLIALQNFIKHFGRVAVIIILLTSLLVICYANGWQFAERIDEIRLFSLMGARRAFIARPFLYTAIVQSILILFFTFGIVEGVRLLSQPLITELMTHYASHSPTDIVLWQLWAIIAGILLVINIATTQVAVSIKLRKFNPQ